MKLKKILAACLLAVLCSKCQMLAQEYVNGIDVSHFQGKVDWVAVYNAGYRFAFVKATQGNRFIDSCFVMNMYNAHNAGILVGAYHFAEPFLVGSEEELAKDAQDEAFYFIQTAEDYLVEGYLRPALDIEDWGIEYANNKK